MSVNISIVIPIYNDYDNVLKLIDNLDKIDNLYEVIFVDASNDHRSKHIIECNHTYLQSEKSRGIQMNLGFEHSTGDVVLFLHSDSIIEYDILNKITENIHSKNIKFGCLSIYFDDSRPLMKICGFMSRWRAKYRKIAFGDQGMFFSRDTFIDLGKFKNIPIMEDYDISIRAKNKYKLYQIDSKIITSSRRFYKGYGVFNRGKLSFIGILLNMFDMQVFQRKYRKNYNDINIIESINESYYK